MQAILHIGDMKCGSKSIQQWLRQDGELLRVLGFHRSAVTRVMIYDSRLASYALDDDRLDNEPRQECEIRSAAAVPSHRRDIEQRLTAEVAALPADAKAMVFSHEMLLSLRPGEVDRLIAMLRRLFSEIRIVAYIRRQDRLFLSLWGQRLKSRDPDTGFCDHLRQYRRYLPMLETWERAVGREHLVVRIFDKDDFPGGDLRADFLSAAGIPDDSRYSPPAVFNESLDAEAQMLLLELCRLINARRRDRHGLLRRLRRLLRLDSARHREPVEFPRVLQLHLMKHRTGRGLLPSRAWAKSVVAGCTEENEEIRRRYFPERDRLFDDDFSAYPAEGRPPGAVDQAVDPDGFRQPLLGPPEPKAVIEAYRFVLGREPQGWEVERERRGVMNIAHLYASILAHAYAN
jgi:hypothetical protein